MSDIKTMPITKARVNLGAVVEKVRRTGESITLEKGGIPVAKLVHVDTLEDMQDALDLMLAREAARKEPLLNWKKLRAKYV